MAILKQLTVFLENRTGILARLTESFKENGISIKAISISDSTDHSFIRIVVNDPALARDILEERGVLVLEHDVLFITIPNRPGALHEISMKLMEKDINIDYLYGSGGISAQSVQLVIRTKNLEAAEEAIGF